MCEEILQVFFQQDTYILDADGTYFLWNMNNRTCDIMLFA